MRYLRPISSLFLTLFSTIAVAETVIVEPVKTTEAIVVPAQPTTTVITPSKTETIVTPVKTTTTAIVTPTTSTRSVIVTPMPQPKEVIATPSGYANCFMVESGWFGNEWIPRHQVCQYENLPGRVAWIEGYWACTKYKIDEGICTSWDWRKGHWTTKLVIY